MNGFVRGVVTPIFLIGVVSSSLIAQNNGGGQGGGQGGGGNQGNGNNGPLLAGIEIDAAGRARIVTFDRGLMAKRVAARKGVLDPVQARPSASRKVSLKRLENVVAQAIRAKQPLSEEVLYLAGLTGIDNVFYFPETQDIVIAGPAEGFVVDPAGRPVGMDSGKCVLQLEDLIVALRAFPPTGNGVDLISVSIDPTPNGLAKLQNFIKANARNIRPQDDQRFARGMLDSLGAQVVSIQGVSPKTHFSQVLLEADYRMKLIGIGLEVPAVAIKSYVDRANPSSVARNAMERWYFVTHYDSILVSEDRFAMEMVGSGLKLVGDNERVQADGTRTATAAVNRASQAFCRDFSERFAELADHTPIYGQLRNVVAISVVAAYLRENQIYSQADWRLETFGDETILPVEIHHAPQQVESAVNIIWRGNKLMTPIGGGVSVRPMDVLSPGHIQVSKELEERRHSARGEDVSASRWWWD